MLLCGVLKETTSNGQRDKNGDKDNCVPCGAMSGRLEEGEERLAAADIVPLLLL
jgi:hypothetical protein